MIVSDRSDYDTVANSSNNNSRDYNVLLSAVGGTSTRHGPRSFTMAITMVVVTVALSQL